MKGVIQNRLLGSLRVDPASWRSLKDLGYRELADTGTSNLDLGLCLPMFGVSEDAGYDLVAQRRGRFLSAHRLLRRSGESAFSQLVPWGGWWGGTRVY